jgi:hypothetical protein
MRCAYRLIGRQNEFMSHEPKAVEIIACSCHIQSLYDELQATWTDRYRILDTAVKGTCCER